MITYPMFVISTLVFIEFLVLSLAAHSRTKHWFQFLPAIFWIYFLPMVASTSGLLPSKMPLYDQAVNVGLPMSLFLLLIGVDLKAIVRIGRKSLLIFLAGSLGIMLGSVVTFFLFRKIVGNIFWTGFGALSASWTGGSANMIAVKSAIGTPDDVFLPMVVVDAIVPYVWMGLLMTAAGWQPRVDRWLKADRKIFDEMKARFKSSGNAPKAKLDCKNILVLIAVALCASYGVQALSKILPVAEGVISQFTWTIILISTMSLVCSLTPLRRLEGKGASQIGYFLLYFVLTTIGVKATLSHIGTAAVLISAGFLIVFIHACVLLLAAKWLKAPMMLVATASQANVGGVVSAPIVAEIYQPGLSAIGLLMAILGNVIGTYLGIMTAQVCRLIRYH